MNLLIRKTLDRSKPNRRDFLLQSTAASLGVTSIVNTLAQLKLVGTTIPVVGLVGGLILLGVGIWLASRKDETSV